MNFVLWGKILKCQRTKIPRFINGCKGSLIALWKSLPPTPGTQMLQYQANLIQDAIELNRQCTSAFNLIVLHYIFIRRECYISRMSSQCLYLARFTMLWKQATTHHLTPDLVSWVKVAHQLANMTPLITEV